MHVKADTDRTKVDTIDELHRLYQARRPHSAAAYYAYRTHEMLHLHFRSIGCRYGKCLCCDYGHAEGCVTIAEIDEALCKELDGIDDKPRALLLGALGSLLDGAEFSKELLSHLLMRISNYGIRDVTIETSWQSVSEDTARFVVESLPGASVTFECGLESSYGVIRSICLGKSLDTETVLHTVRAAHDAHAGICANVMLGAPFLSVSERMEDARESILWALEEAHVDDVVLFPVNVRPYTALRALYDLALYRPTRLWEMAEVLASLPDWALARTHVSWWGNRSTSYSLGNIAPSTCDVCRESLMGAMREYSASSLVSRSEMSARRREVLDRLLGSEAGKCSCWQPYRACGLPTAEELRKRRSDACACVARGGAARLVWVSPRESDLNVAGGMFVGSSTVYGSNENGNRSYCAQTGCRENHNDVTQRQIDAMACDQIRFALSDESVRFMAYNPYYTHGGNALIVDRSICLNDKGVLDLLCDKRSFRQFARPYVSVPDFIIMKRSECTPDALAEMYPEGAVIQRGISSGGEGTFVVLPHADLPEELGDPNERLLVSRLSSENVPINVHAVIFERSIVLFPGSTQLIEERDGRLLYCGCDYVSFGDLSASIREEFYRQARALCSEIAKTGYRGILGLDAMVVGGRVLFLEMNSRFQASSHALNQALSDSGLPTLHQLHREAFLHAAPSAAASELESVRVEYASFAYSSRGSRVLDVPVEHLLHIAGRSDDMLVFDDGLDLDQPRRRGAYMFGVMVRGRVSSIHFDCLLNVDQNVSCWGEPVFDTLPDRKGLWMRLKIALLNQGCTIAEDAMRAMDDQGGVREGVNDAVDLEVFGHAVNVPIRALHQELSPFRVKCDGGGGLVLEAYGRQVCPVAVSYRDQVQGVLTPSGVPVSRICLLATDRVRVQHHDCCDVVESGLRCRFCNFPEGRAGFDQDDIDFAISSYLESGIPFRHFLVGGGSDLSKGALERTIEVVRSIRSRCDKPVYLMDLPPADVGDLVRLKDAGVNEVAFNIEVFDRTIAKAIMPLKGSIPLSRYVDALKGAVELWGDGGNVRSALVVGIEPMSSTLAGIDMLASMGVAPILSVFRPVSRSEMERTVGPDNTWLMRLYKEASAICSSHGIQLGPECEACRNNVLAP